MLVQDWDRIHLAQKKGLRIYTQTLVFIGGQCRIRTCGLWLRRPTLYPTELIAREERIVQYVRVGLLVKETADFFTTGA